MRRREPQLRADVDANVTDDRHHYTRPCDRDTARRPFRAIGDALQHLRPLAEKAGKQECADALVYVNRRVQRVFSNLYREDSIERDLDHPTKGEIFRDLNLHRDEGLPARTITVETTEETLELTYEHGFHATEQTRHVTIENEHPRVGDELYSFGEGVTCIHAPSNPSPFEAWRYRPSRLRVSIEGTTDPAGVRIGVDSTPPDAPLWYRPYVFISQMGGPYAKDTLNIDEQTSVVQFTIERRRENIADN